MRIAFWNTHKNETINEILCDIIYEKGINIIVLAEYNADSQDLIQRLSLLNIEMEPYLTIGCDRIVMFGSIVDTKPGSQNKYFSTQIVDGKYILCGIHLPSKIYSNHQERRNIVIDTIIKDINELERKTGIEDTIILGDLNENPYDPGCLEATKFHGIPSGDDAVKNVRTVMNQQFKMFYNPMWNLFGDFNYPPGTYYYNSSDTNNSFWNIFDQVMIRPNLKERFVEEGLEILTETRNFSLVDKYKHPCKDISDHLPIIFEIREGIL